MLAGARQITDRNRIDNGKRLERWVSGSAATGSSTSQTMFATLWNGETPQIVGLCRGDGSRVPVVLFATDPPFGPGTQRSRHRLQQAGEGKRLLPMAASAKDGRRSQRVG